MEVHAFPMLGDLPEGYVELRPALGGFRLHGKPVRLAVRPGSVPRTLTPYDVRCPQCGAPPWDPCRAFPGHGVSSVTHDARRVAAAEGKP